MIGITDDEGTAWEIYFTNSDKTPIEFEAGYLSIRMICEEDLSDVSLGEYEYYTETEDNWLHLECDAGEFSFRCDDVQVGKR